jgi:hypothetical protein
MAVVYRKLVLLELKRLFTDGTIIHLELQKKVVIARGQPKTIQPVHIRFTLTAQKIAFVAVNDKVFPYKLSTADSAEQHIDTPVGRTGA